MGPPAEVTAEVTDRAHGDAAAPDELAAALRAQGYRVTGPRLAVYDTLGESGHVTADELVDLLADEPEPVGLSTVYRSLAVLEELGLVRATRLGTDDVTHWERAHPDEHFHVVCTSCGDVDHHRGSLVALVTEHLRGGHDFEPEQVTLLVHGRCGDCRPNPASPTVAGSES